MTDNEVVELATSIQRVAIQGMKSGQEITERKYKPLLEATKNALLFLDPLYKLEGKIKTEDMSDREKLVIDLYQAVLGIESK